MRVLWLLLALLIGIGAGLLVLAPSGPPAPAATTSAAGETTPPPVPAALPAPVAPTTPAPKPPPAAVSEASPRPDSVRRAGERVVVLADRFEVTGNGSEADPYRIRWELLDSVREGLSDDGATFVPPPWIASLDGSWVELSGYVSTPLVVAESHDVLFTKNRWDGCCIGIPPTPFDSIETRLDRAFSFTERHGLRFAVMRGQLRVDPMVLAGTILGVYRIEHGTITTRAE